MLLHRAPKYGNDNDAVDAIAQEVVEAFCTGVQAIADNRAGPAPRRPLASCSLGFRTSRICRLTRWPSAGRPCSEQPVSCGRHGPHRANGRPAFCLQDRPDPGHLRVGARPGPSTAPQSRAQRDSRKFVALLAGFLKLPSTATLQVNVIDRDTLLRARGRTRRAPIPTLLVRVWGFSAVFVELPVALQDHVIARTEHTLMPSARSGARPEIESVKPGRLVPAREPREPD